MSREPSEYVSTGRLAAELRAIRWEFRCLLILATLGNAGIAYGFKLPPAPKVIEIASSLF